jgi:isocitrate dehydrogenase
MTDKKKTIVIPFIPGDGIGPEIMKAAKAVVHSAIKRSSDGAITVRWVHLPAGEESFRSTGEWLPESTLKAIKKQGVALKGPLTTPVGGGIRSLNVTIRQKLDLYASVRPVKYFEGAPSPVKNPHKMNVVIFRENTEDVYKGIEWKMGSAEAMEVIRFLSDKMGVSLSADTGIGIKPVSEFASKRLVRAALKHAVNKKLKAVTLVHKGNIMKFTEGAFKEWGYELASAEFSGDIITEAEMKIGRMSAVPAGKVLFNDRIADNMFQQILTRPDEYSVLATPNLNGDYLADACAAQIGGLGLAPGANIGDGVAVFEAVHGTAPKYAGKNIANPCSLMLSGAMMLEHLGMKSSSEMIEKGIASAISEGVMTHDLARMSSSDRSFGTKQFTGEVLRRMQ